MNNTLTNNFVVITGLALLLLAQGCAVVPPETVRAGGKAKKVDLRGYQSVRVVPATVTATNAPATTGQVWAELLAAELRERKYIPPVTVGAPTGKPDELVVSTTLTTYARGNAATRTVAGGGTEVKGEVVLSDAARPDLYRLPVICESAGGIAFGGIGMMGSGLADADYVLKSAAQVSAMYLAKAKWK